MTIFGSVENIIYHNSENGYSVFELDSRGQPVTCVGNFPVIAQGEYFELDGEFKTTKYGEQFSVTAYRVKPPDTVYDIARYLGSGLIKGVGEITAAAIVERFGTDTMSVIEYDPARLKEVRGISERRALEIGESVRQLRSMQSAVMFLQKCGVTPNMALKIYKTYGDDTEETVARNPYKLVEDVDGIGFLTADRIARNMGIEPDSEFRIRAGMLHALREMTVSSGSTYLFRENLVRDTMQLLHIRGEENQAKAEQMIDGLAVDGKLICFEDQGVACVALTEYYRIEKALAAKLVKLKEQFTGQEADCAEDIAEYERINGITLHEGQRAAVEQAVNSGVAVITGGPGTGKTTIVRCIMHIFRNRRINTVLCAPTGRAAKRLSESTGEEAFTIHRLLDLDYKDGKGFFTYNENTRLPQDAVIVDEVSMVDCYLMNCLARAVRDGKRLILVGDKDQLPSVSAGNVLSDIIESGIMPVTILTQIYRQSEFSQIVTNAHRINCGEMPEFAGRQSDFLLCEREDGREILQEIVTMYTRRIPEFLGIRPQEIQVLAPLKKGQCGVENVNATLQRLVNPARAGEPECALEHMVLRKGDKVMQTVNNYKLEWTREGDFTERGVGVFNGDIGYVESVTAGSGEVAVLFEDGRRAVYNAAEVGDLTLSYCISIHKSQGCEFDVVIIPVTAGRESIFNRNLLYTAITRARKLVVLIGTRQNIRRMVANNYTEKRYTLLCRFLHSQKEQYDALFCQGTPLPNMEDDN